MLRSYSLVRGEAFSTCGHYSDWLTFRLDVTDGKRRPNIGEKREADKDTRNIPRVGQWESEPHAEGG